MATKSSNSSLTRQLKDLAAEIREHEREAQADFKSALTHKIEIGNRLIQAKELLPHGEFLPWAEREFRWDERHIRRHMQLWRNRTRVSGLPPEASLRMALAAIKETREERRINGRPTATETAVVLPATVELMQSSAADLISKVAPDSVDAIITDPPYSEEYLSVYDDLGKLALGVLKTGGSLLAMVGQYHLPAVIVSLSRYLSYHWMLAYLTPGGQAPQIWPRHVNTFWKPVLWFVKGEYDGPWVGDVLKSAVNDNDKRFHDWGQSESGMADIMERFTAPGELILDPFLGGGTTGVVAARLARRFIGADLDVEAVRACAGRLAQS
jgi:hypothetical protein